MDSVGNYFNFLTLRDSLENVDHKVSRAVSKFKKLMLIVKLHKLLKLEKESIFHDLLEKQNELFSQSPLL